MMNSVRIKRNSILLFHCFIVVFASLSSSSSSVQSISSSSTKFRMKSNDYNHNNGHFSETTQSRDLNENRQLVFPIALSGTTAPSDRRRRRDVIDGADKREYVFAAFGRRFHAVVAHDDAFMAPDLVVRRAAGSDTWLEEEAAASLPWRRRCFYAGNLLGQLSSRVVLNVCDGVLSGHIGTEEASYFIEPLITNSTDSSSSSSDSSSMPAHVLTRRLGPRQQCSTQDSTRFDDDLRDTMKGNRRRRRSISHDLHIEVMVTADSTMKRYHGSGLHDYILTLMSTVAQIFRDSSIGNAISVSVVKIVVTEEEEDRDFVFTSAPRTLRSFCKWQSAQNYHDDTHYLHYDTAILLTREDICRSPKKCDTLGLADLGTMCDMYNSCAIVEDNGLSTAFTIAHEMGHVLNLPHDDDIRCRNFTTENNLRVMARFVDLNTNPWSWSACSAHYLTEFLEANGSTDSASCLKDKPTTNRLAYKVFKNELPGQIFSADKQCELLYGDGSSICPYMPSCGRLWCLRHDNKGCRTHHMPWADGTLCSDNSWCFRGSCKRKETTVFRPTDGQWSRWSEDGPCSRTCGGGIKRSVRYCNNPKPEHGGKYCIGERVRYKSCHTEDCPAGSIDFREAQCSAFNNYHFSLLGLSPNTRWVPKYSGISLKHRCKLYCRVSTSSDYYVLRDKVVDGTSCGTDTTDICVNGHCLPAGCDHKLYSKVKLDNCGLCGGNNGTCQSVSGYYNKAQYGYNRVVLIAAGSISVDVKQFGHQQIKEDDNYLALVSDENEYILNGDFTVTTSKKKIEYGGAVLEYTGSNSVVERINSSRPLQRDLIVEVLSVGKLLPPDIHYVYNTPLAKDTVTSSASSKYAWDVDNSWSECSKLCHGQQQRQSTCVIRSSRRRVSDDRCRRITAPDKMLRSCNDDCQLGSSYGGKCNSCDIHFMHEVTLEDEREWSRCPRWKVINRTDCLTNNGCGQGIIKQMVRCIQQKDNGERNEVAHQHCSDLLEEKPADEVECHKDCPSAAWEYSSWTECSKTCDGGTQSRTAYCRGNDGSFVADDYCSHDERLLVQSCGQESCPKWKVGEWTACSKECKGERQRPYWCDVQNVTVSRTYCDAQKIPDHVEACSDKDCYTWDYGQWSICPLNCEGNARRLVRCRTENGHLVNDTNCDKLTRPADNLPCSATDQCSDSILVEDNFLMPSLSTPSTSLVDARPLSDPRMVQEPRPVWKTDNWDKCSVTCGTGTRSRRITCIDEERETVLEESACLAKYSKPVSNDACEGSLCYRWRTGEWTKCSKTCGGGVMERIVVCENVNGKKKMSNVDDCDGIERPLSVTTCNEELCPVWVTGEWNECSKGCGSGSQQRSVYCGTNEGLRRRPDEECQHDIKPNASRECNKKECFPFNIPPAVGSVGTTPARKNRWKTGPWSSCPVTCGTGVQKRQIICLDQHDNIVPPTSCALPAPPNTQECKMQPCLEYVFIDDWSMCSHTCGGGSQWRMAICVQDGQKVDSDLCKNGSKAPMEQRACHLEKCPSLGQWKKYNWHQCNKNCVKHRRVVCVDQRERPLVDRFCSSSPKPRTSRRCKKCYRPYKWVPAPWTECSTSCSSGYRARTVACHRVNRYGWTFPEALADHKSCNASDRPTTLQRCNLGECGAAYRWETLKWQPCSITCGRGIQKRGVRCFDKFGNMVPRKKCPIATKPLRHRRCKKRPCGLLNCRDVQRHHNRKEQEYSLWIRGKNVSIYCADMDTADPKEYLTVPSTDRENFSEIYEKRLIRNDTCPNDGHRMESCECSNVGSMAGLTVFQKIRLNITSLRIIIDDFRFTKQIHGSPISFGKAGDCYSLHTCPQGRFSVDLTNTGFTVDNSTTWIAYGTRPYRKITGIPGRQKINGLCGGYCGVCMPDPGNGFVLDVKQPT